MEDEKYKELALRLEKVGLIEVIEKGKTPDDNKITLTQKFADKLRDKAISLYPTFRNNSADEILAYLTYEIVKDECKASEDDLTKMGCMLYQLLKINEESYRLAIEAINNLKKAQ